MTTLIGLATAAIRPHNGLIAMLSEPEHHVEFPSAGLGHWQQALLTNLVRHLSSIFNSIATEERTRAVANLACLVRLLPEIRVNSKNQGNVAALSEYHALSPFIENSADIWLIPGLLDCWVEILHRRLRSEGLEELAREAAGSDDGYRRLVNLALSLDEQYLRLLLTEVAGSDAISINNLSALVAVLNDASPTLGNEYPKSVFTSMSLSHLLALRALDGASPSELLPALVIGYNIPGLNILAVDATLRDWVATPEAPLEWFIALHGDWASEDR